jgi:hypothetical protein
MMLGRPRVPQRHVDAPLTPPRHKTSAFSLSSVFRDVEEKEKERKIGKVT